MLFLFPLTYNCLPFKAIAMQQHSMPILTGLGFKPLLTLVAIFPRKHFIRHGPSLFYQYYRELFA